LRSKKIVALVAIAGVFGLVACAARPVTPTAMAQTGDDQLSCSQLSGQLDANTKAVKNLLHQDKDVETGNAAKVAAGAVIAPIALATDFSNTEQIKARALLDRNERLTFLLHSKGCN
jgi:hypothetical protein